MITGARGLIGGILMRALRDDFDVAGVDRRPSRRRGIRRADVSRLDRAARAVRGADVIVHLAANPSTDASWTDVQRNNIPAAVSVLEAARLEGVARVVLASSNHVVGMYERDEPYASIVAGRYGGLTAEAAARFYADEYGLSTISLRIGTVNRAGRPTQPRHFATLLTHRDLAQLVRCAVTAAPELRNSVYFGVSGNTWRIWDLTDAESALGYRPEDDAEAWR